MATESKIKYPLVSLISVNYNQPEATAEMIASALECGYPALEIIIIDNGSAGTAVDSLTDRFPAIRLIKSPANLGFAGANNLGIRQATGQFLLFLNNDAIICGDAIAQMVKSLAEHPLAGVVSPKIRYHSRPDILQYAGSTEMSRFTLRSFAIGYHEQDRGQYDTPHPTPFAHGAAMMVRAGVVASVGPMAEIFFLYYEELDWCVRIRSAGFQILYEPRALVLHKESLSIGKASPLKTYYLYRSRLLFLLRNLRGSRRRIAWWYQNLIAFPKNTLVYILRGQGAHARAMLQAWKWIWQNLHNPELDQNRSQ